MRQQEGYENLDSSTKNQKGVMKHVPYLFHKKGNSAFRPNIIPTAMASAALTAGGLGALFLTLSLVNVTRETMLKNDFLNDPTVKLISMIVGMVELGVAASGVSGLVAQKIAVSFLAFCASCCKRKNKDDEDMTNGPKSQTLSEKLDGVFEPLSAPQEKSKCLPSLHPNSCKRYIDRTFGGRPTRSQRYISTAFGGAVFLLSAAAIATPAIIMNKQIRQFSESDYAMIALASFIPLIAAVMAVPPVLANALFVAVLNCFSGCCKPKSHVETGQEAAQIDGKPVAPSTTDNLLAQPKTEAQPLLGNQQAEEKTSCLPCFGSK